MKWIGKHKILTYWIVWVIFNVIDAIYGYLHNIDPVGRGAIAANITWITFISYMVVIKIYERIKRSKANV